jgi:hypothetical protein
MSEIDGKKENVSFLDGILADGSEVPQSPEEQPASSKTGAKKSIPEPQAKHTVLPEDSKPISSADLGGEIAGAQKDASCPAKPISERKLAANRENAKFSTGPKTAKGKATSSSNSTKHGIFSRNLIGQDEQSENDRVAFDQILDPITEHYQPEGTMENLLVEKIAVETWRFSLLLSFEQDELRKKSPFWGEGVDRVLRYQAGINRQFFQAIEQLERLQAARQGGLKK